MSMFRNIATGCMALLFCHQGILGGAEFGEVIYPAYGNLRGEEGTLIISFRIDEPMPAEPGAWYQPRADAKIRFTFAEVKTNEQNRLNVFFRVQGDGGALWTSMQLEAFPPGAPNLNSGGEKWKTGETHFVAYSWDSEGNHRLFADGKLTKKQRSSALRNGLGIPAESGEAFIKLGSGTSMITLYGVHVLDKALSEEDLSRPVNELFKKSPHTLLLDVYGEQDFLADGKAETRAEVISGFHGEHGGVPSKACSFVETPEGRGLRLYSPP